MNRPRHPLPIAAFLCAALLAGCGSSERSSSTGSSSSSSGSTPAQSSSKSTSTSTTGNANIQEAVADCKKVIQGESKLPAGAKEKLEGACAAAAKGDTAAVKKAAREVCEEVIDKAGVPDGSAKEAALKACRK